MLMQMVMGLLVLASFQLTAEPEKRKDLDEGFQDVKGVVKIVRQKPASESPTVEGKGSLEILEGLTILHLKGTPHEMGYQHGKLLSAQIKQQVASFIDNPKSPINQADYAKQYVEQLPSLTKYIPERFLEEIRGLAEGSGVPYNKLLLLNVFPEMFHCSGVTVSGQATTHGELYHARVLDFSVGKGLQGTAVVMVVQPEGKIPFLNVSYAGFIGSVTGMNDKNISIGEIGGKGYGFWEGVPMSLLLRDILERAAYLPEAMDILSSSPRTCEYYYIIADGKSAESVGAYATASQLRFINPGESYSLMAPGPLPTNYGTNGINDKFFSTSYIVDCKPYQTVVYESNKKDKPVALFYEQPKDCVVLTGFTTPERYSVLIGRLMQNYGYINVKDLQKAIKDPVSCGFNLHNAIFASATLDAWISNAGPNQEQASDQPYYHINLVELLK